MNIHEVKTNARGKSRYSGIVRIPNVDRYRLMKLLFLYFHFFFSDMEIANGFYRVRMDSDQFPEWNDARERECSIAKVSERTTIGDCSK